MARALSLVRNHSGRRRVLPAPKFAMPVFAKGFYEDAVFRPVLSLTIPIFGDSDFAGAVFTEFLKFAGAVFANVYT
jgi:hypothetical protein